MIVKLDWLVLQLCARDVCYYQYNIPPEVAKVCSASGQRSSKSVPKEDLLPLTLYIIEGDLVGPGAMVRYISPLQGPPPPQWVARLPVPKSAVPDKGGWMGGVPISVFNKIICAYSWFDKWNITLIQ